MITVTCLTGSHCKPCQVQITDSQVQLHLEDLHMSRMKEIKRSIDIHNAGSRRGRNAV